MSKDAIINCHTHIFTGDHVPPYLAKTYVPPPFHVLIHLKLLVLFFRWWNRGPATVYYTYGYKKAIKIKTAINRFLVSLYPLNIIAGYYLFFFAFFLLYNLLSPAFPPENSWLSGIIHKAGIFLSPVFPTLTAVWLRVTVLILLLLFFATIRNMILFVARLLWKALGKLPGKQTKEMFNRYLNIGRYAFHEQQSTIFSKLKDQYPAGTGFVILPMDMDYMEAGKSTTRYRDQMQKLAELKAQSANKDILYPFVFADPRRFVSLDKEDRSQATEKEYFNWTTAEGKITLGDCFIREYLEQHRFSGIKIYPALGYFPFDEQLLPLYKYAADNNIPVLTHCIKGTIFYRGLKKKAWDEHPVFKEAIGSVAAMEEKEENAAQGSAAKAEPEYGPLVLPQTKNVDFSYNFTHPLNYLCLLEEPLLRELVGKIIEKNPASRLGDLFGYNGAGEPMKYNLRNLKICLGHFGGDDEWLRYFEKDRYNYSSDLVKHPQTGINFFHTVSGKPSKGKLEQLWKFTDWYSIICSMMLQYPRVYADISYILHGDQAILPLLKQTLLHPVLKEKVLYGTDFFVVRNHKSDKNMLADMMGGLSQTDFDQIARVNPLVYLKNDLPLPAPNS